MIWRAFRKAAPVDPALETWWREANALTETIPETPQIERLARTVLPAAASPDDREQQEEMLDALRQLADVARGELPRLVTQHRVIGADVCHLAAPAGLGSEPGSSGKLFLTSMRLVFAGGRVQAWPWHRIRSLERVGRALEILVAGADGPVRVVCNCYADAVVARHVAGRLRRQP